MYFRIEVNILTIGMVLCIYAVNAQTSQEALTLFPSPADRPQLTKRLTKRGTCGISKDIVENLSVVNCPFVGSRQNLLKSRIQEIRCCAKTTAEFENDWYKGGKYLQTYFEKLFLWRCTELYDICAKQTYSTFSQYSNLTEMYYCDNMRFGKACVSQLASARGLPANVTWDKASNELNSSELTAEDLTKPCIQVAVYHSKSGGYGYYHEIVQPFTPFCHITWCGADAKTMEGNGMSAWACLTKSCQTNLIIACVVCALLAMAIVLANITVIAVFTTSPKLRNSQAVYKISLAIADLLVGIFVIPTYISSLLILYQSTSTMGEVMKNSSRNQDGTLARNAGGSLRDNFTREYLNFVGFFTILSLLVSLYTLMMASCDRFMAIYQPLRYGRHNAKKIAKWASLLLWVIAILVSSLPFLVSGFDYGVIASIMVASHGESGLIFYGILAIIPLILVWISTLATYISTKVHARRRQHLTVRRSSSGTSNNTSNMEARLAKTLASMVGVFTLCLLPPVVVLLVPYFVTNIYPVCVDVFEPTASKYFVSMEFVAILLLMTNSLWNCFIYNARNEDFKFTAKRLYRKFLVRLGFRYVWGRTRSWASSTRSGRTTTATTTRPSLRKMISKTSLGTLSSDHGYGNGKDPSNGNGNVCSSPTRTQFTETNHTNNGFVTDTKLAKVNHAFELPGEPIENNDQNVTETV